MPRASLEVARVVIDEAERLQVSEQDSHNVLELVERAAVPNEKLLAAARAFPDPK
jgi:uncharacterized protein (DUF1778 family)